MLVRLLLLILLLAGAAVAGTNRPVTLLWDYPLAEQTTNIVFVLHATNLLSAPLTNWPIAAVVPGTNTTVTLPSAQGWQFFYVTASNDWGESDPSNTVGLQTPRPPTNLLARPKT